MTTLKFPELDEVVGKIALKNKELAEIVGDAKTPSGELDLKAIKIPNCSSTSEKAAYMRSLNDEITDLGKERDDLKALLFGVERVDSVGSDPERGDDRPAGTGAVKSFADHFIGSPAHRQKGVKHEFPDMELKTLMTTSAGWAPETTRGPRVVDFATRPIEMLDIIPTTTSDQAAVTWMEETTFTNNAAETTEGSLKPEAALAFTQRQVPHAKIAVTLPVTDEQLEDVPRLRGMLDNRLPFMVKQRLAGQIVAGNGTPPNMRGFLNTVGIQTQAKGADPTPDAVYKAMVKVMTVGQALPDAYVTNPLDWQDVRLLRTTDGIYIFGSPSEAGPERIWGLRTVLVQAMTENTGLVGDFQVFSELAVRKGVTTDIGYVNAQFAENEQTLRSEMRAVLVVYRPAAFCTVTGI